jgi:hypothetical protein
MTKIPTRQYGDREAEAHDPTTGHLPDHPEQPHIFFVAREPKIQDLVNDCAKGTLPFDQLVAQVAAMGYNVSSLHEWVTAVENHMSEHLVAHPVLVEATQADNAKFKIGEKVRMVPVMDGNPIERSDYLNAPQLYDDVPMERGIVRSSQQHEWGISYIVQVHEDYKDGEDDDLLRELTEDQILWLVNDDGDRLGLLPSH